MNDISNIAWLFPIIFMIHDFEEILFIKSWKKKKYVNDLRIKPYKDFISTRSFSVAVAQEFVLFAVVTQLSVVFNNYIIWFGFFTAIGLHFLIHCIISIINRHYHPGLITSIFSAPLSIYLLSRATAILNVPGEDLLISSVLCLILLAVNLKLLHKLMPEFDYLVKRY